MNVTGWRHSDTVKPCPHWRL